MTPLCNKANCLHDKETSESRLAECNAYVSSSDMNRINTYIQYYEGNIYYVRGENLYRLSADGSKKDCIFSRGDDDEDIWIESWLIHRGVFYYNVEQYYYPEGMEESDETKEENFEEDSKVYRQCIFRALPLSSNMKEKGAEIIYENDKEHNVSSFGGLSAYKNYITYTVEANENTFEMTDFESWARQLSYDTYLYNAETGENKKIEVPEGHSETTVISDTIFMKDKMLFTLYDELEKEEFKSPIYSINYDLTGEKVWLDKQEQDKQVQSYKDYVIISDSDIQYFVKDNQKSANIEIYNAEGKRISYFVYPMNVMGNFNGFGPDGVNVEFEEDNDSLSVYELDFDKVKNCHGETVALELVAEREYK